MKLSDLHEMDHSDDDEMIDAIDWMHNNLHFYNHNFDSKPQDFEAALKQFADEKIVSNTSAVLEINNGEERRMKASEIPVKFERLRTLELVRYDIDDYRMLPDSLESVWLRLCSFDAQLLQWFDKTQPTFVNVDDCENFRGPILEYCFTADFKSKIRIDQKFGLWMMPSQSIFKAIYSPDGKAANQVEHTFDNAFDLQSWIVEHGYDWILN